MKKEELRQTFLKKRDSLSPEVHKSLCLKIFNRIINWEIFINARIVMTFVSFSSEINTHLLIQYCLERGKKVAVPKVIRKERRLNPFLINKFPDDLEVGNYSILEPHPDKCQSIDVKKIDLIFVPGIVFDRFGYRIGYGKGYFDNFLGVIGENTRTCGLCFSFQVMDKINHRRWDKPVEFIMNETGLIRCR